MLISFWAVLLARQVKCEDALYFPINFKLQINQLLYMPLCAGTSVLLSNISPYRWGATCAIYKDEFWIVGGLANGYLQLDTVESFSFR
jgi:hypothetical protein